ncbi:MAG: AAA family ATPase [Deltaproteobacteria bacterium]|nr:AAA family ATPase [Deltaproteobacteria bacterium]
MKIFATYNIKGGVGKTAAAVNLSYVAAQEGARALVWDLDPQGAASFYFRIKAKIQGGTKRLVAGKSELDPLIKGTDFPGLDLLPADFSLRHLDRALDGTKKPAQILAQLLQDLEGQYDFLFLDCPPSISLASRSVFVACDALLVPTIPTPLSLRTLDQLAGHLKKKGPKRLRVLPFFCMVDRRKILHRNILEQRDDLPMPALETTVPYSTYVEQMGIHRAPLGSFAHRSAAAESYRSLWKEILLQAKAS